MKAQPSNDDVQWVATDPTLSTAYEATINGHLCRIFLGLESKGWYVKIDGFLHISYKTMKAAMNYCKRACVLQDDKFCEKFHDGEPIVKGSRMPMFEFEKIEL